MHLENELPEAAEPTETIHTDSHESTSYHQEDAEKRNSGRTGPTSFAGRQTSARNATRHGMCATTLIIAGEAEAIEKAKNGDAEAFSKLYALHKRRVYTLCLRMLGNVSEAEDMTQEAFLHLFRKLGSFRGESAFSTWLHRLTVNLVLMHLRKKGLNLVSLEETINPSEENAPKRDFGSRDTQLAGSVDRVTLERAVASLPPGYRMVFVLHDVEGFEHNEIATMLECSTGNSKSQLHKARLKLRELLRQPEKLPPVAGLQEAAR